MLAAFLKLYAIFPMIGELRLRAIALSLGCIALTIPLLPWGLYLSQMSQLTQLLSEQSQGGRSATSIPVLVPVAAVAILALDRRTSGWLVVPALWPATQLHYSLMALPVIHPIMAFFFCVPAPGFQAIGVIAYAIWVYMGGGPRQPAIWKAVTDRVQRRYLSIRGTAS